MSDEPEAPEPESLHAEAQRLKEAAERRRQAAEELRAEAAKLREEAARLREASGSDTGEAAPEGEGEKKPRRRLFRRRR
jgi:prefoldin subunit 5